MFEELVCPKCEDSLKKNKRTLFCANCKRKFPIRGNIAILWSPVIEKSNLSLKRIKKELQTTDKIARVIQQREISSDYGIKELLERHNEESVAAAMMEQKIWNDLKNLLPPDIKDLKILNIGAGMGKEANFLKKMGAGNIVLLDLSLPFLKIASHDTEPKYCIVANAEKLPLQKASFDLVLFGGVLHHLTHPEKAIKEAARVGNIVAAISEPSDMRELRFLLQKTGWNIEYGGLKSLRIDPAMVKRVLEKEGFEVRIKTDFIWYPLDLLGTLKNNMVFVNGYYIFLRVLDKLLGRFGHNLTFLATKKKPFYDTGYYSFHTGHFMRQNLNMIPSFSWIKEKIDVKRGEKILDAGSGSGYLLDFLQKRNKSLGYGIDISPYAVDEAQKSYPHLFFKIGNLLKIPFPNRYFDKIVCFNVIEHINQPKKVMDEFRRILKPGGILVIGTNIRDSLSWKLFKIFLGGDPTHIKEFTKKEFIDFIGRYFKLQESTVSSCIARFPSPINSLLHTFLRGDIIVKAIKK